MAITIEAAPIPYNEFNFLTAGEAGKTKVMTGKLSIGTSYTTGGELIVFGDFDDAATAIQHLQLGKPDVLDSLVVWVHATGKIQLVVASTGLEVASAVDVSTYKIPFIVFLTP